MITKMRGFTLIETLLALAILAVLSAAAVMVLQNVIRADGLTREKSQQIAALPARLSPDSRRCHPHHSPSRQKQRHVFLRRTFQLQSDDWGLAFQPQRLAKPAGDPPALGDPERQLPSAPAAA
ncbi:general secretion pathway protein J [Klebsiella pneumoniae]|uniref:General secretion pathway protein J n=1 Tax=Klebsiella pneumoniae TaxID=573 RepID=A0A2X3EYX5_KLEPN|nr:general secretion pathway protein J [Klebsiella pneumoniae]